MAALPSPINAVCLNEEIVYPGQGSAEIGHSGTTVSKCDSSECLEGSVKALW